MFKKIATNILIIAVLVVALDFIIGKTLRYFYFKEESGLHYRTTYAMDSTKAEILIFGSSRANHHYVPKVFEDSLQKTFYNAGRDGNGIFFQVALLTSIVKRYSPKIVVLEFSGEFEKGNFDFDKLTSLLPYYKTHKEIRSLIENKDPFEKIESVSEIYPFNSQALTILIGNLDINKKRMHDDKGYIPLYKKWKNEIDSFTYNKVYEKDTNKVNAFRNFIRISKASGAEIFVVRSPIFRKLSQSQGIAICNAVCSDEKIPFWDFSNDSTFLSNNFLFQDIVHLNDNGAVEFSKLVVAKIKQYNANKSSGL